MAPKKQRSDSVAPPDRDTIRFLVHNGAMRTILYFHVLATVEYLVNFIVANPSPFHGDIVVERTSIKTMDGAELPVRHCFGNVYSVYELKMALEPQP